jgi:hypothetical protein
MWRSIELNECSVKGMRKVRSVLKFGNSKKLDLTGFSHDMEMRGAIIRAGRLNFGSHCGL